MTVPFNEECPLCESLNTILTMDSCPQVYECLDCGCEFEDDGYILEDWR